MAGPRDGWRRHAAAAVPVKYALHASIIARRLSRRSILAYAASALLRMVCARAASATSRGWPVSPHQSRKLERNPCGTASPGGGREHEFALLEPGGLGQEIYGARTERYAVFSLGLHPFGRDRPEPGVEVDFVPDHEADLARAGCGEDEKLEGEFSGRVRVGSAYGRHLLSDLVVGQRALVLLHLTAFRQGGRKGVGCRVVGTMAGGDGRFHDGGDALASAPGGLALRVPDGM